MQQSPAQLTLPGKASKSLLQLRFCEAAMSSLMTEEIPISYGLRTVVELNALHWWI